VPVNRFNHWPQQVTKVNNDLFQLLIERVIQNFVIQVAHEVNQTSLLWAVDGIVSREKVGY
jgi:hypothetical protein